MNVPPKAMWKEPPAATFRDMRSTIAIPPHVGLEPAEKAVARDRSRRRRPLLGGLEIYWGHRSSSEYVFAGSQDGEPWTRLCGTRHGEGGQEVFGFPPTPARFVRWSCENPERRPGPDIVEINLYGPADAATTLEAGRIAALGHAPVLLAGAKA